MPENPSLVEYNSRLWQSDEGLPQSGVLATAQTSDGYLWVGTTRGLTRFDGAQFKLFDNYNSDGLQSSYIAALCAGRGGVLWVGTAGGGLTELKDGRFKIVPLGDASQSCSIKTLFETHDGALWVGTLDGMFQIKNGAVTHWTEKEGLLSGVVRAFCEVGDEVWIGTGAGINIWKEGKLSVVKASQGQKITALIRDRHGGVWAGCDGGLAMVVDGNLKFFTRADSLPDNRVTALWEDHRGDLWVGTADGLGRLVNGKLRIEQDDQRHFLDQINSITEDHEGDIWVGCRDGLEEFWPKRFTSYTRDDGLSQNNIVSVMEDEHGTVWVGTAGGGLNQIENGRVRSWKESRTDAPLHPTDFVLGLGMDSNGGLLVGTDYEGGVFRFAHETFTPWDEATAFKDRVIRVIYRDRENHVWFGTSKGLVLADDSRRFMENSVIRCILEDHAGTLWVGTTEGLFFRTNGRFAKWRTDGNLPSDTITALYEDAQHSLWIGTERYGLHRLKNGRLNHYTAKNGLLSNEIFEILEDEADWLWMTCSKGIFRVKKKDLDLLDEKITMTVRCISYGKADGMETVQCSGVAKPSGWKGKDGRLWFATTKGLVVTDPRSALGSNDQPPMVQIEDVLGDQQRAVVSANPGTVSKASLALRYELPPGNGNVEVHYCALSFQAPQKIRFKYKLEGIDSDWVEVSRRTAYYNHLPPGEYVFRIMASNNEGVWNKAGATAQIWLKPHFWQQWWFRAAGFIAAVFAACGMIRFLIRRRMRHELNLLQRERAIQEERTRIARDMHDEIGAKLTKISFLGAAAKRKLLLPEEAGVQIEKMSVTAREVIRSLDEIVWALNPANDSVEDLASYLSRNATEFFDNSPIKCHLDIPEDLPAAKLGTEVRHNVILAAKEALNNVLKHSEATRVTLRISLQAGMLVVEIGDNGRGFDPAEAKSDGANVAPPSLTRRGNGLSNMRHRLQSIGGHCHVAGSAGNGTRIRFSFKLELNAPQKLP